jgi:outer membrane receptor protein involved in Fe transport
MRIIVFFVFILSGLSTYAQYPGGGGARAGGAGAANANIGHFYGKVVDAKTNKGIDAASIQLVLNKFDTVSKTRKETIVSGMLTKANGQFSLENLSLFGNYKLRITAIGYTPIDQKVAFEMKQGGDMSQALAGVDKDLGNIKMEADAKVLENVTVTASKPLVTMGIDRKVFNVEKSLTSVGGSAVDVMRNVPSVQVDIDGNVTLRNSSPQIFVDGRPSTLTLEQIPADAIQSVEVITNPSAKYDASGGNSGILNIVLKKNRKTGYNGNVRAGVDSRGKINLGGDLNIRQGKVNAFLSGMYNERKSISDGHTERLTFFSDPNTQLRQTDKKYHQRIFGFLRGGVDYFLDNRNTLSISGNAVRGEFKPFSTSDIYVDTLSAVKTTSYSQRNSNSENLFKNYSGTLSYKHNFAKAGKEITSDINYSVGKNVNQNFVTTNVYNVIGGPLSRVFKQQLDGGGLNKFFTAQVDYVNPLGEKAKVEMGARLALRNIDSKNDIGYIGPNGEYIYQPQLSSKYKNSDNVYAAYTTYTNNMKDFGYQLGLRAESYAYDGNLYTQDQQLKDSTVNYTNNFPISFFPSVFLSQKLKHEQELQLNYTRRINRPNFFQLFPFTDYSDSLNLSRGNPALKPEFTNSLELSYSKTMKKGHSILVSAYYKYTTDLITRSQVAEPHPGKPGDTILINTYINANSSNVGGIEFTSRNPITKWWETTTNVNLFTSKINLDQPGLIPQDRIYSWFAKMSWTFKIPKNFTLQVTGDYTSKTILPPGGSGGSGGGGGGGGRPGGGGGGFFGQPQSTAARLLFAQPMALMQLYAMSFLKQNRFSFAQCK